MQTVIKIVLATVIGLGLFTAGGGAGFALREYIVDDTPSPENEQAFALYWEVWNRVEGQFYGEIPDTNKATYGAIRGTLQTLDDPYTVFIEPEPAAQEKAHLEGQFGGIGAYVSRDEAGLVLLEPMPERPAEVAGLLAGDVLIAIDGHPITITMTTDEVVNLIRGEVDTEVVLTVEREGEPEPLDLTVVRAIIETPSVNWFVREEDETIGYIQMTAFTERTVAELDQALTELAEQNADSYILDLRNNGGGLLDAAVDVASQFLRDGIVLTEDRTNEDERTYEVRNGSRLVDEPLVLLVNGGTASASEIVAGALQDYDRATLIGEKTFGKGSVQLIYELSDSSRLHVTVAKWFTPNKNAIDGLGLTPDIEILFSEEDHAEGRDPQLQRAIEYLQNGE